MGSQVTIEYAPRHARRRRLLGPRGTGVVAAAMLASWATPADAFAATAPRVPAQPRGLPAGIEPFAPYQPQEICYPAAQPGVVAFRDLVLRTYPRTGSDGILLQCSAPGRSEHKDGRAWDWLVRADVPQERADAQALLSWLLKPDAAGYPAANARRLGIMYIIWDRKMWRAYAPERGWQPYTGVDAHRGHVHFSFGWAGALAQTSFYSGHVAPPVLSPGLPLLATGSSGPAVHDLQVLLRVKTATGVYGAATRRAVATFQRAHRLPATGLLTRATWAALLPPATAIPKPVPVRRVATSPLLRPGAHGVAVRSLQALLGVGLNGRFGPSTRATLMKFQQRARLVVDGVAGPLTWRALRAAASAKTRPRPVVTVQRTVLRPGATGPAVRELQLRLHMRADGAFGPVTERAVLTYQARHGLKVDGVVGARTWQAVEKS
ncbi:MAG: hypothetical protein QOK14_1279 [Frankiaceae bacterium]|nr:hypothetical protein [Frankiaceae bacterium]